MLRLYCKVHIYLKAFLPTLTFFATYFTFNIKLESYITKVLLFIVSSGKGRRLILEGCEFKSQRLLLYGHFHIDVLWNCNVWKKKLKISEKEAGVGPFLKGLGRLDKVILNTFIRSSGDRFREVKIGKITNFKCVLFPSSEEEQNSHQTEIKSTSSSSPSSSSNWRK